MKLDAARLCLDCEEIHESQICPICSSEAFAYLTRWVQPSVQREAERRALDRPPDVAARGSHARTPEQVEAYRQLLEGKPRRRSGIVTGGMLGLAAVSLAGWALRASTRSRTNAGEAEAPSSRRTEPGQ
jgi:hypothetical protein